MKKSFAIIALAALVMLAGCKKNDPKPNGTRLIAGIEKHKSDSKTSLDGTIIKWSESDKLYVNNGTTPATFTLVSGAGTTTGEFATTGEYTFAAENNVAVYPNNYVSGLDNTMVTMSLPAVQTASGSGTFGNGANPMLGVFSDMDNLTLTSLCGVLCLQLWSATDVAITAIEIVGGPDDKLNGTFTANYKDTDPVLAKSGDDGNDTVRLNCPATLTSTPQKFYVVVPAGTLHGFTMKVYDGDNEIFSKSTANEVPVYVNTLSTMNSVEVVPFNPLATPLTFEARVANVSVGFGGSELTAPALEYSKNGSEWTSFPGQITLENVGDIVSFRGNNSSTDQNQFSCYGQCYIYGNVMSLLNATDFATMEALPGNGTLRMLFYGNTNIDIPADKDLVLSATTLTVSCYQQMFQGCTGLTKAPILPATELASNCYRYMFDGCTNLQTAPVLPATELASNCYFGMFKDCTNLQTAPELPATTLADNCYFRMFEGCQYINSITCTATSFAPTSTFNWVNGVAATGTFYADPSATWSTGNNGIPTGWTRKNPDGSDWVEPVPTGAINGLFSVSTTKQVWFSQGNLQATTSDLGAHWTWHFAEHQYDCVGNAAANNAINGNGTVSTNGSVDFFGWSTAATYYGIYNSASNADYSGDFVDWGSGLTIGGDAPGTWRTLTITEWNYLFNERDNHSNLYSSATVAGRHGYVLLPDNWVLPTGSSFEPGLNCQWRNTYTASEWATMEEAGAVFLPALNYRYNGTNWWSEVPEICYYWTSTPQGSDFAKLAMLTACMTDMSYYGYRCEGYFVRLVQ